MGTARRLEVLESALRARHPDLERLERRPRRDDLAFGDLPVPAVQPLLDAWLYAPAARTAYPVLLGDDGRLPRGGPVEVWRALLSEHLHALSAGRHWTALSVVAMPLLPPFDEPGLRVRPLLALQGEVSADGGSWLSEVMVATVRNGRPHVLPVLVFSAGAYRRNLVAAR